MEDTREQMQEIAKDVKKHLPEGFGFFVLVFPFNDANGRANYVSDGKREDVIKSMKEFIIKAGHSEDWMKHLNY